MNRPSAVYFFGTCLVDLLYPRVGTSAMRLLAEEGIRVVFPHAQTCCGQPAWNSGYRDEARAVARLQLDTLAREIPVVVPSGSCAGMLSVHYPELFAGTPDQARAEFLAARIYELTDFLTRVLDLRPVDLGPPVKVALHSSCSARREMGVGNAAMRLLSRLSNVTAVEPERAYECCGFGGTFAVKEAEISAAMAADKCAAVKATGADVLVSQDCGCLMNLEGTFRRQRQGPRVMHIAELLWERIRGE
jgi:L-lactate dehydrogenase complex protein LldE